MSIRATLNNPLNILKSINVMPNPIRSFITLGTKKIESIAISVNNIV